MGGEVPAGTAAASCNMGCSGSKEAADETNHGDIQTNVTAPGGTNAGERMTTHSGYHSDVATGAKHAFTEQLVLPCHRCSCPRPRPRRRYLRSRRRHLRPRRRHRHHRLPSQHHHPNLGHHRHHHTTTAITGLAR